nr:response regulator [Stigmatella aurantiaca]
MVVRIRDTGIGIPSHKLPDIFELFAQADESLERSRGGLGIGLTLVRNLVELHGGTIGATSDGPGQGSEFVVKLPVAPHLSPPFGKPQPPTGHSLHRRILLVEDNSDARQALKDLLELWGHRVQVAQDGMEGLALALEVRPDLALVDIGLPGLDGYRVAKELRARVGRNIRLVAITGYGGPEDRSRALQAGFDHHMVKPVKPDELNRLLMDL